MIFGALIAFLKGSEPPVEFGSKLNESEFINTTVQVGEEKSGFTYVSSNCLNKLIVFCCIAAWIQPDISGCQQDFLVVWRWNQLITF